MEFKKRRIVDLWCKRFLSICYVRYLVGFRVVESNKYYFFLRILDLVGEAGEVVVILL